MQTLPTSIAAHLLTAGFSSAEILVLRHACNGMEFTVRQLAAKTGKSTGVLDRAVQSLLGKKILFKEIINGLPRYALSSPEKIVDWMREDMGVQLAQWRSRERDVHRYVRSLKISNGRPKMEYFEGENALEQAYMQLLEKCEDGVIRSAFPLVSPEEQDPLFGIRQTLSRERRRRGVEARVLLHDTPLGRRFRSRDHLADRRTVLVPPESYPITFEQVIAGNVFACVDYEAAKVCLIQFPHLAQAARQRFDARWAEYEDGPKNTGIDSIDRLTIQALELCS